MNDIKPKILDFLYKWTHENKLPHIRKGMVEDLEGFVAALVAEEKAYELADRMKATISMAEEPKNAKDSK